MSNFYESFFECSASAPRNVRAAQVIALSAINRFRTRV